MGARASPTRAEAWFYLGAAYGVRVQYHGAARRASWPPPATASGSRPRSSRALALDPALDDANAGLGLYRYYADVAPSVLKVLRWFLGLPGGDRVEGPRADCSARASAACCCGPRRPTSCTSSISGTRTRAARRSRSARRPARALSAQPDLPAERRAGARGLPRAIAPPRLAVYESLVDGARGGSLREPVLAEALGTPRRGGAARRRWPSPIAAHRRTRARCIARRPAAPYGARGAGAARPGPRAGSDRRAATRPWPQYRAALAAAARRRSARRAPRARARACRGRPIARRPTATRLSLDGWRAFERGDDGRRARGARPRACGSAPDDGVHPLPPGPRPRARPDDRARAQADFERALRVRPLPPRALRRRQLLRARRDVRGAPSIARAIAHGDAASRAHGAPAETRAPVAQRALARSALTASHATPRASARAARSRPPRSRRSRSRKLRAHATLCLTSFRSHP
ncbi:MAG: hypothetical protein M0C28_13175 [Candidatus Moduliflexus flocculans]|nr:hypothetical protein [Candidatus Moduliflexus flocculans]